MSVKSFLFDFGLPGLAAVGVGLATYMLTGGPEEFPEPTVVEDLTIQVDGDEVQADDVLDEEGRALDESKLGPPTWALDIVAQNKSMAEELRLLKEATQHQTQQQSLQFQQLQELQRHFVCEECKESTITKKLSDTTEAQKEETVVSVAVPVEKDWLLLVRHAVWQMASHCADCCQSTEGFLANIQQYRSNSETAEKTGGAVDAVVSPAAPINTDLTSACDLLLMYLNNILKNPTVPRYRRLATTNNSYLKSLSAVQGHDTVLASVGFTRKPESNCFEYEWHSLPSSPDGKSVGNRPKSSQEAINLLKEAVELLTALKSGSDKLATALVEKLTNAGSSENSGESTATTNVTVDNNATEAMAKSDTAMGSVSNTISAAAKADDGLVSVSVVEVSEQESLSGDSEAAAAVDFMQILKKAQESRDKSV